MPYDGTDFEAKPPRPPRITPPRPRERLLGLIVFLFALVLLVAPISAGTFVDLVHYVWRR